MGAAAEIVKWSENRPPWQRDALRRLATKGELGQVDLDELLLIADKEHGLADPPELAPIPVPLASTHLRAHSAVEAVSLRALSDVACVNALAPKQRLDFDPEGLTVIYGDNATGKSGYIRILKRLCRARAAETILGNVFDAAAAGVPRARVEYAVGAAPFALDWRDGTTSPNDLGAVSIFDSPSAAVYVNVENDVAYLPFGLDLLPQLVAACDEITRMLDQQLLADTTRLEVMPPHLTGTASGGWLANISYKTSSTEIDGHAS